MTRTEHNDTYGAQRMPRDRVYHQGYGDDETQQFDPFCPYCLAQHDHTWSEHDDGIADSTDRIANVAGRVFSTLIDDLASMPATEVDAQRPAPA